MLALARTYGSAKYQALALARLGRAEEAAAVAIPLGSDAVAAEVPPERPARAALDRMAARLPPDLRPAFLEQGRLARVLGDAGR